MASCKWRLTLIPVVNEPKNENWIDTMRSIFLVGALVFALVSSGCAGMSDTEQRAGSGAAIGAGAGLVGGLMVDKREKDKEKSYQDGYEAGQQSQ